MPKLRMNWGRIAVMAGAVVLLAAGLLAYDALSQNSRAQVVPLAPKTPAHELTVKVIPLLPGPGALEVIAKEGKAQRDWAKRLTSPEELQTLTVSLAEVFAFDYQFGEPLVVPDDCFIYGRKQYDADKVQFWLVGQRNRSDYLTLGMLPAYMYADNRDWLSGRARLGNPVAIMSSWRMGLRIPEGDPRLLSRWHTLVRHELGHTLGLHHVETRSSLMFGGKSLEDLDAQSTGLTKSDWQRLEEICPVEWE